MLEPVGSAAPKVNIKLKAIQTSYGEKLALVCPAQGMPLPAFRWVLGPNIQKNGIVLFWQNPLEVHPQWSKAKKLIWLIWNKALLWLWYALLKALLFQHSGSVFSLVKNFEFLEPIGKSAPKFTTDSRSQTFYREKGTPTALLCAAQGAPIPTTRFKFLPYLLLFFSAKKIPR